LLKNKYNIKIGGVSATKVETRKKTNLKRTTDDRQNERSDGTYFKIVFFHEQKKPKSFH